MGDITEAIGEVVTAIPVVLLLTGTFLKILMTVTL
jgi:hypothetical protein